MSSNSLIMSYKGGDLPLAGTVLAGGRAAARSPCVQAVGGGLSNLAAQFSDDSALGVCIQLYTLCAIEIDAITFLVGESITVFVESEA